MALVVVAKWLYPLISDCFPPCVVPQQPTEPFLDHDVVECECPVLAWRLDHGQRPAVTITMWPDFIVKCRKFGKEMGQMRMAENGEVV